MLRFGGNPDQMIIPLLEKLGIGFVRFSPLGKEFITGKMPADNDFDKTHARNIFPQFNKENRKANQALEDLVTMIAAEQHATPARLQ